MNATEFAPARQNSSANERAVPVVPERPNRRIIYPHPEAGGASYKISLTPSFDFETERGDGYWIVRDRETGIYGHAEEVSEALREFYRAAAQHLDTLERQDTLSEELSRQSRYLRTRLRR